MQKKIEKRDLHRIKSEEVEAKNEEESKYNATEEKHESIKNIGNSIQKPIIKI